MELNSFLKIIHSKLSLKTSVIVYTQVCLESIKRKIKKSGFANMKYTQPEEKVCNKRDCKQSWIHCN